MTGPVSDRERSETVGGLLLVAGLSTVVLDAPDGSGSYVKVRGNAEAVQVALAALGLDPGEVLDGPLVVLHPGESVCVIDGRGVKVTERST